MKKLLSMLLVCLLLIGLLAACAPAETPAAPTETTPPAETPVEEPADEPAEEPTEEPADTPAEEPAEELEDVPAELPSVPAEGNINPATGYSIGGLTLPLAEELTELTAFRSFSGTAAKYLTDPNEMACNPIIEEYTNIHIKWNTYSAAEQFPLYIAAQDFDDMIMAARTTYTGGVDKAIEDEVYVPANDYLQYMPNFSALFYGDRDVEIQCKTDTGNIFFNNVQTGEQPAWIGPMIRTDWLDELGMDIPMTFDEWHTMLTGFKNDIGAEAPLMLSTAGYSTTGFGLTVGYHTAGTFYAENGTTVKYGFLDEGMRQYTEMMAQWYAEGLVDKDFVSHSVWVDSTNLYTSDAVGAFDELVYTFREVLSGINPDEDDDVVAVPFPTVDGSGQGSLHFRRVNPITGDSTIFITTGAVDRGVDELCAKWIDYRYSEDGYFTLNWGVEGQTWELGEDGIPHFTDFYLKNPDYSTSEIEYLYTDSRPGGVYAWIRENDMYSEAVLSAYDIWNGSSTGDWVLPTGVTLTSEEAEDYSSIYNNIQTYVNEMILRFITGTAPMSEWDAFVDEIYAMGIEDCIAYQQTALDRYNTR